MKSRDLGNFRKLQFLRSPALGRLAVFVGSSLALVACSEGTTPSREAAGGAGVSGAGMPGTGGGSPTGGASSGGAGSAGVSSSGASGSSAGVGLSGGVGGGGTAGGANGGNAGTVAGAAGAATAGSAGDGISGMGAGGAALGGSSGDAGGGGAGTGAGGAGAAGAAAAGAAGGGGANGGNAGTTGGAGAAGAGYSPCPTTGACKIMPFGDSITEGYPVEGGYRVPLFRLAREAGNDITFVGSANNNGPTMVDGVTFPRNHEGHGGYTIDTNTGRGTNGISPLVDPSMENYTPHIITLMIGTNDLNGNIDVPTAPDRLGALLDRIYAADANVLVILAQIVPTRSDGTNQTVQNYNAAMPELVSERTSAGRHLVLIDMYGAFTRDANYKTALLGDNLHPNQAGYTRMAETWFATLSPYLR